MLTLTKCPDIFETRLQPQIVSGERLSMLQDNGFFSQSAVFPPCHARSCRPELTYFANLVPTALPLKIGEGGGTRNEAVIPREKKPKNRPIDP